MSKAKSFKKTIVVAAAAGMMITTSIGTVSAGTDIQRFNCRYFICI